MDIGIPYNVAAGLNEDDSPVREKNEVEAFDMATILDLLEAEAGTRSSGRISTTRIARSPSERALRPSSAKPGPRSLSRGSRDKSNCHSCAGCLGMPTG